MISTSKRRPSIINFSKQDTESQICRSTPTYEVLHRGGQILKNNIGSAATYELSEFCDGIDSFISHNWSSSPWLKWWALVTYFNSLPALMVTGAVVMITTVLAAFEIGPYFRSSNKDEIPIHRITGSLVSTPVFFTALVTWHEIQKLLSLRSRTSCFLDKTCIHQVDIDVKLHAIGKLGAFLHHSKRLVICYTDVYLKKLWTMYEVACWTLVCPEKPMDICHLHQIAFVSCLHLCLYIVQCTSDVAYVIGIASTQAIIVLTAITQIVVWSCIVFALAKSVQQQVLMSEQITRFKVSEALCFDENDRPLVENNIIALLKYKGHEDEKASAEEAFVKFEMLVQDYVKIAIKSAFGKHGIRYSTISSLLLALYIPKTLDECGSRVAVGQNRDALLFLMYNTWIFLVLYPLLVVLTLKVLCKLFLLFRHHRKTHGLLILMTIVVMGCLSYVIVAVLGWRFYGLCLESNIFFAVFSCLYLLMASCTVFTFSEWSPIPGQRGAERGKDKVPPLDKEAMETTEFSECSTSSSEWIVPGSSILGDSIPELQDRSPITGNEPQASQRLFPGLEAGMASVSL